MGQVLSRPYRACILATVYLTIRELLNLFFVSETVKDYLKKKSNQFGIAIITMSWTLLYAYLKFSLAELKASMAIPSAFIIIFGET